MKLVLIGGKDLIDAVFLSKLSQMDKNLSIECYLDSGEVSFGSKKLNINNIEELNVDNVDILINLSDKFSFILDKVKHHNENSLKKVIYFNCQEGSLLIDSSNEFVSKNFLILIPNFGIDPVYTALKSFQPISFISLFMCQPIAELGKEYMNIFHKEIKESGYKIIQYNNEINQAALAFNISYSSKEKNFHEFDHSESEVLSKNQIHQALQCSDIILTQARVSTNKGSSIMVTFELKRNVTEQYVKKKLEDQGILYVRDGFSTILAENDSQIYVTKIKKCGKKYSFVILFDSLQRYVTNVLNAISNFT